LFLILFFSVLSYGTKTAVLRDPLFGMVSLAIPSAEQRTVHFVPQRDREREVFRLDSTVSL
jgi:hypothetical protein